MMQKSVFSFITDLNDLFNFLMRGPFRERQCTNCPVTCIPMCVMLMMTFHEPISYYRVIGPFMSQCLQDVEDALLLLDGTLRGRCDLYFSFLLNLLIGIVLSEEVFIKDLNNPR